MRKELDIFNDIFSTTFGFDGYRSIFNGHYGFPPYDIIKHDENHNEIVLALAGFSRDDVDVSVHRNMLTIQSVTKNNDPFDNTDNDSKYIKKGIAQRYFKLSFPLAEHVEVTSAWMKDGQLHVELVKHVPDEEKPKKIEIKS